VLDAYSDALLAAKLSERATAAREDGLRLRKRPDSGASVTQMLLAHVGLADAATKALQFDRAFGAVAAAREVLQRSGKASPASTAGLARAEATIADCSGDSERAVALSDAALRLAPLPSGPLREPAHVTVAVDRIRILRRAAATGDAASASKWSAAADALSAALVSSGSYDDPLQLPRRFSRGLPRGQPWHSFARAVSGSAVVTYPQLRPLRQLLMDAAGALRIELSSLQSSGLMQREEECIHDPTPYRTGAAGADSTTEAPSSEDGRRATLASRLGSWTYFTVNGHWLRDRDADGCAPSIAPVACKLLRDAAALRTHEGAPLVRARVLFC
jgi:hypothetical protein